MSFTSARDQRSSEEHNDPKRIWRMAAMEMKIAESRSGHLYQCFGMSNSSFARQLIGEVSSGNPEKPTENNGEICADKKHYQLGRSSSTAGWFSRVGMEASATRIKALRLAAQMTA